jgi:hypothetical protein
MSLPLEAAAVDSYVFAPPEEDWPMTSVLDQDEFSALTKNQVVRRTWQVDPLPWTSVWWAIWTIIDLSRTIECQHRKKGKNSIPPEREAVEKPNLMGFLVMGYFPKFHAFNAIDRLGGGGSVLRCLT